MRKARRIIWLLAALLCAALAVLAVSCGGGGGGNPDNNNGDGGNGGNQQQQQPDTAKPPMVTNLSASYSASAGTVTVRWDNPRTSNAAKIEAALDGGSAAVLAGSTTAHTFTGIEADGTVHTVTVTAVSGGGTKSDPATCKVTASGDVSVASVKLAWGGRVAPGVDVPVTVALNNADMTGGALGVRLLTAAGDRADGAEATLTRGDDGLFTGTLTSPSANGDYTVEVLMAGAPLGIATNPLTVADPVLTGLTLYPAEIDLLSDSRTVNGQAAGDGLGGLALTAKASHEDGASYTADVGEDLGFTLTLPQDAPNGTYTVLVLLADGEDLDGTYGNAATFKATRLRTVTYVTARGSLPAGFDKTQRVEDGTQLTAERLPALAADGWVFGGWYIGDTRITAGYIVTGDMTLTAKWTEDTGSGLPAEIEGIRETLKDPVDTADGFEFTAGTWLLYGEESGSGDGMKFAITYQATCTVSGTDGAYTLAEKATSEVWKYVFDDQDTYEEQAKYWEDDEEGRASEGLGYPDCDATNRTITMAVTEEALAARESGTYEDLATQLQDAISDADTTVTTNADKTAVMMAWTDTYTDSATTYEEEGFTIYVRQ